MILDFLKSVRLKVTCDERVVKSLLKDESSWDNSHPFVDEEHLDEMIEQ